MKREAYCRWHNCLLRDVREHMQEQCEEANMHCDKCEELSKKEVEEDE